MKRIYNILALGIITAGLSSCVNNWLDQNPSNGTPTGSAITNYNDARTAMYGMYDGLQGNSDYTQYYAARMFYYGDVRGDDMQARTQGMRTSSCYEMRYTVDDAPNMWNIQYNVIRRANRLIEAVDNKTITDAEDYQDALADIYNQAKVVRALVHFDLVKVYGMPYTYDNGASLGVPFVDKPLGRDALPGRDKVSEVYAKITKDLEDAINSEALTISKKAGGKQGYIDLWAAKALLCRVYLYMNKNQEAFDLAKEIIKDSPYKLWTINQYAEAWDKQDPNHTQEMIFEIINNGSDDWADREGIGYLLHEDGYADAICTKSFVDMLQSDPEDVRNDVVLPVMYDEDLYAVYGENPIFINKFPLGALDDMRLANLPILRLSEVYLNAAEAAAKLGGTAKAEGIDLLNKLLENRTTAVTAKVPATIADDEFLTRVLIERRKELVGEGQRFFDAMRNDEKIIRYTNEADQGWHYSLIKESQSFDRTYTKVLLPIPVSETNVNPTLKAQQNPGY
ncbi:RagB/SusD family nutrient uptake outer membrane protein [uncultured Bacteroides sp.]|uniref:RagB/SusD family nutrient uptake outer membrane protein n=1 Tax=uncultured Bacteroides sp. TaxID=162156 RepID=UPI0026253741|nr:RagB/SusD family nutrient uptake outer membrane protein [uncultured Bacteroides sp.]